jgi:uncharacterized protein (DUF1697 family)
MATYVSMLRGINVGRKKRIKMEDLKDLYRSLDFKDVRTYIQSGNVVFKYHDYPTLELREKIGKEIKDVFGFDVSVIIRTKDELQEIIENNPFQKEDIKQLHVTFLSDIPTQKTVKEIDQIKDESERFSISGKEIYLFLPHGYGRTRLSNDFFEKKLNVSATTRNWKTVNKLLDIADKKK